MEFNQNTLHLINKIINNLKNNIIKMKFTTGHAH